MTRIPKIVSVRDLRRNTAAVLDRLRSSGQPLLITRRGRSAAVMLGVSAYDRGERERELLRLVVRGEQEIEAADGHDLEDVQAEADAAFAKPHAPRPGSPPPPPIE